MILNPFECSTVSLSTQILILTIVKLLLTSNSILYEFAMLQDVYILLPEGRCTHLAAHLSKKAEPFACHDISMFR